MEAHNSFVVDFLKRADWSLTNGAQIVFNSQTAREATNHVTTREDDVVDDVVEADFAQLRVHISEDCMCVRLSLCLCLCVCASFYLSLSVC